MTHQFIFLGSAIFFSLFHILYLIIHVKLPNGAFGFLGSIFIPTHDNKVSKYTKYVPNNVFKLLDVVSLK